MKRVMLEIAYDGSQYSGFANQKDAVTIEGTINKALFSLTGEKIEVIGASRTDAGVHAYRNVAVFDTDSTIPADRFLHALNHILPEDIRVQTSKEVDKDFHPRHCKSEKTYEYRIYNSKVEMPIKRMYTCFCSYDLDEKKMQEAANYLVGEHDFTSFCNTQTNALTRVRTVNFINVKRNEKDVIIEVNGNGFLYNMVRIIAGTLIEVGRGKLEPNKILKILEKKDRNAAGPTAPPQGLFLMKYKFFDEKKDKKSS